MLDMFPSVETVTSLNSFVQDAVVAKEITESKSSHNVQNTKSDLEVLDENVGRNINIQI